MYQTLASRPTPLDRVRFALTGIRDWLDERGKPAWIVAMILGFVAAWPVGLAILAYMIWSKRMSCNGWGRRAHNRHAFRTAAAPTGNAAFDAYRSDTLKRLEEEREAFTSFLDQLRRAKDQAEFDQFMASRQAPASEGAPEAA